MSRRLLNAGLRTRHGGAHVTTTTTVRQSVRQTITEELTVITTTQFNEVEFIMAYEAGDVTDEELIAGFQNLVNSGRAFQLQGHYQRMARDLIESGAIDPPPGFKAIGART